MRKKRYAQKSQTIDEARAEMTRCRYRAAKKYPMTSNKGSEIMQFFQASTPWN